MAAKTTKNAATGEQLSVPGAITEVAKAALKARSVQPEPPKNGNPGDPDAPGGTGDPAAAAAPPKRSRAELQADIAARRAELEDVVKELETRLDVSARVTGAVDDIRADPLQGAKKHPKTVIAAAAVAAAATTAVIALVRALTRR